MDRNCERHTFELADGECRMCHGGFCVDCLLRPFGEKKPGLCKDCAITAGGLRQSAARPVKAVEVDEKPGRAGLFARLRGAAHEEEPERELSPEEVVEQEAVEIAAMMADQRIPATEEPEPEPVPVPANIAPPGLVEDVGDERPARREDPEDVAGGLDLPNKEPEGEPLLGSLDGVPMAAGESSPAAPSAPEPAPAPAGQVVAADPPSASSSRAPALFEAAPPETAPPETAPDAGAGAAPTEAPVTDTRPGSEGSDEGVEDLLGRIADLRNS